jgi:hypothetical protein
MQWWWGLYQQFGSGAARKGNTEQRRSCHMWPCASDEVQPSRPATVSKPTHLNILYQATRNCHHINIDTWNL